MRWSRGAGGSDIDDREGEGLGRGGLGGLPIPLGARGLGGGGLLLVVAVLVVSRLLGGDGGFDPGQLNRLPQAPAGGNGLTSAPAVADKEFIAFVYDDVQDFWTEQFAQTGVGYKRAVLVLYNRSTRTGCGVSDADEGPFYCPSDQQVYLDRRFFTELVDELGAGGDFAQAYVIAHELGHHVQQQLGISDEVEEELDRDESAAQGADSLSVRLELQADCLAGVWAHSTYQRGLLEPGDLEEALAAAASVGDDRLQEQAGERVQPETFTHGTAEQRQRWFSAGYDSGDPDSCDTFEGDI